MAPAVKTVRLHVGRNTWVTQELSGAVEVESTVRALPGRPVTVAATGAADRTAVVVAWWLVSFDASGPTYRGRLSWQVRHGHALPAVAT